MAAAAVAAAQDVPIKVDVDVVNVLCNVYDRHGALVNNLDRNDFLVREDGKPQPIRYFARETDLPLTIALLVDVSGSVRRFVQAEKETAERFFQSILRPQDQALLTGFSSTVVPWQDFTASPARLLAALETMRAIPFRGYPTDGRPVPGTLLYDAVESTARGKLQTVGGRKAMVIISDGVDIGSRASLAAAVRAVQTANTIVFGICYLNPRFSGCAYLKELADPTGGRMFQLDGKTPLEKIFQAIQEQLRSQYSLGFSPRNTAHDGRYRKLEIRVKPRGLRVEARKGYYAPGG